jgi:hypothetical protein
MLKLFVFLLGCASAASDLPTHMLIFDRSPSSGATQSLGLPKQTETFLADDFQVGADKEVWVVDHVRVWALPDPQATSSRSPGDLFKKISFYGGIAPDTPTHNQKADVECDCHNLPPLKTAILQPGSDSTDSPDVLISSNPGRDGLEAWQIDFENLRWSVPGATNIQFGILAEGRQVHDGDSSYTWYNLASPGADGDHLRVFSSAGKLQSAFHEENAARMNIQVWGHLLARISIRSAGQRFRVILQREPFLDASQIDTSSLRFGPRSASPEKARIEDVDHKGKPVLVMDFRAADSGIPPESINACLTGRRLDGAPFEGCDLLRH